ncbi:hypothetical protein [Aquimarina sp. RZ0]|uniref:hypothetical protein n=1 Tax=Aquimarina sp. RZ0 TaxID=2607730 RepID=UPI0011F15586|nr:hypothetical protein [Aquimarina sp. RZ0]KAA1248184.1 hypothetical protein F0000_00880 [Aquimarina sp. RZ0]
MKSTPLHLYQGKKIQGQFISRKLNLLLMFQVNCPGCFLYALPTFNQLYKKYKDDIGIIALSTAFEDFELNTSQNTTGLVEKGTLVGHTKKALQEYGYETLQIQPEFPIIMDKKMEVSQLEEVTANICSLYSNFLTYSIDKQELIRLQVSNYLKKLPEISLTFTSNQFKGTPTFALFNDKSELLHSWFGHIKKNEIVDKIKHFL